MIVLDTNQLDILGGPRGALSLMLTHVAARSGHRLAIPRMVLVEHLAHHEHDVAQKTSTTRKALEALGKVGALPDSQVVFPSVQEAVARRQRDLSERFVILDAPAGAAEEALEREARRRRPANISWQGKGIGARDVVVWLTVLDTAATINERVLFVTEDLDFADSDGALHPELLEDLRERGVDPQLLQVHKTAVSLLESLAHKVDVPSSAVPDLSMLVIPMVEEIAQTSGLEAVRFWRAFHDTTVTATVAVIRDSKRGKVEAYDLGDDERWLSAERRWTGEVEVNMSVRLDDDVTVVILEGQPVPFTFDGTILASLNRDGQLNGGTLLGSSNVRFDESGLRPWRRWPDGIRPWAPVLTDLEE